MHLYDKQLYENVDDLTFDQALYDQWMNDGSMMTVADKGRLTTTVYLVSLNHGIF